MNPVELWRSSDMEPKQANVRCSPFVRLKAHTFINNGLQSIYHVVTTALWAGAQCHAPGMDSTVGPFVLNHLFILKNEGNKTRQLGLGRGECQICPYFPRFPILTILMCSKSEIYTKWLQLQQMSKISSPILLGGHVPLGYLEPGFNVSCVFLWGLQAGWQRAHWQSHLLLGATSLVLEGCRCSCSFFTVKSRKSLKFVE